MTIYINNRNPSGEYEKLIFKNVFQKDVSDGFHTFQELYDIRLAYNAALFNTWANLSCHHNIKIHKSYRHYDGSLCFCGGWFIVCAELPDGVISNHYENIHWNKFRIKEVEKSTVPFDGHTTKDVIKRLLAI